MKGIILLNLLMFLLIPSVLVASEYCQGTTSPVSLYDKGKALYGVKSQDQDGLETCYANVASLVIKSYNPTKPVPSYLDIASYNNNDENKYDFNQGLTCNILNKIKDQNPTLCKEGILENLPLTVQDEILYTLYNIINDYNYTPSQMDKTLKLYDSLLAKNPFPKATSCENEVDFSTIVQGYLHNQITKLISPAVYLSRKPTTQEKSFAKDCSEKVRRSLANEVLVPNRSSHRKEYYGDYRLSTEYLKNSVDDYVNILKSKKFPSGKSYYQTLIHNIDEEKNIKSLESNYITLNTASSYQNAMQVKDMLIEADKVIVGQLYNRIYDDFPDIRTCLESSRKKLFVSNAVNFMENAVAECKENEVKWDKSINEAAASCAAGDIELLTTFKTLTSLGESTNNLKDYLVKSDKNILKEIINNNCKEKSSYSLPSHSCSASPIQANLVGIKSIQEWKQYQAVLDKINKVFGSNTSIPTQSLLDEFVKEVQQMQAKGDGFASSYSTLLYNMFQAIGSDPSITKTSITNTLKMESQRAWTMAYESSQDIYSTLKSGKAVGITTCASLFNDIQKGNYEGCNDHSVALTGYKCVNGKLKVEVANSFGIGCVDDKSSLSKMECQRDRDGLTNGRSWIDLDYISNFGIVVHSY